MRHKWKKSRTGFWGRHSKIFYFVVYFRDYLCLAECDQPKLENNNNLVALVVHITVVIIIISGHYMNENRDRERERDSLTMETTCTCKNVEKA